MKPKDEFTLILPARIILEIESSARARGIEPGELVREASEAAISQGAFYAREMAIYAKAIDEALAQGEPDYWPEDLNDCLVVSSFLGMMLEKWAETYLMEMTEDQMDFVEFICRKKGLSYEGFITEAIETKFPHLSHLSFEDLSEEDDKDQDEGEEWKAQP
jgi:hypothetical protein